MVRESAGELSQKASKDKTRYDPLEVGEAQASGFNSHLIECAKKHSKIIDEDEFYVVFVLADDPILKNVQRRKFYAWPFLPKPRPRQGCFLYNKKLETFRKLWILPQAATMSILSETTSVSKKWQTMKDWSDAFFSKRFHELIRSQTGMNLETETEYLNRNREKLIHAGCNVPPPGFTDPLDLEKIYTDEIVNAKIPVVEKDALSTRRKT